MLEYLKHSKSLVAKGKKCSSVATPTSSPPSASPSATPVSVSTSASVAAPSTSLPSLASEEGFKNFVQSMLASFLSQLASQMSLGFNPSFTAPSAEVLDVSHSGSAGGSDGDNLLRGRQVAPSGVVPPPLEDDVISSPIISMPVFVASGSVSGVGNLGVLRPPLPSLGQFSVPNMQDFDQSRARVAPGFGNVNVSVSHDVRTLRLYCFPFLILVLPLSLLLFLLLLLLHFLFLFLLLLLLPFLPSLLLLLFLFSLFPQLFLLFSLFLLLPWLPLFLFSSFLVLLALPLLLPLRMLLFLRFPLLLFLWFLFVLLLVFRLRNPFLRLRSLPVFLLRLPLFPLCPSLSSLGVPLGFPPVSSLSSSSASSPAVGDFADFQARVLGLSLEYQALGRWFVASGGSDFRSYIASHCPHLYADFRADFASGSSRFLAALASSASLPSPSSVAASFSSVSQPPLAPAAPVAFSSSLAPSAPPPCFLAPSLASRSPSASSSLPPVLQAPPVSMSSSLSFPSWRAVPVVLWGLVRFLSLFLSLLLSLLLRFSDLSLRSLHPRCWFLRLLFLRLYLPLLLLQWFIRALLPLRLLSFRLHPSLLWMSFRRMRLRTLPRDVDSAVPESVRSSFVDLFPQAAVTPSSAPPPRAFFEDFSGSPTPTSPVFLSWFERVRTALLDADAGLASFLSSGCADFSFLPRNSSYAVWGEFASGQAVPVNPSLLYLFEKQL